MIDQRSALQGAADDPSLPSSSRSSSPNWPNYLDATSLEFLDKEVFSDLSPGERRQGDPAGPGSIPGASRHDTYLRLSAQESLLFAAQADTLLNRTEKNK